MWCIYSIFCLFTGNDILTIGKNEFQIWQNSVFLELYRGNMWRIYNIFYLFTSNDVLKMWKENFKFDKKLGVFRIIQRKHVTHL